jgi:hypothetical protein
MCWAMSKVVSFGCHVIENPIFDGQNMLKKGGFLEISPKTHIHCVKKMELTVVYSESSNMG